MGILGAHDHDVGDLGHGVAADIVLEAELQDLIAFPGGQVSDGHALVGQHLLLQDLEILFAGDLFPDLVTVLPALQLVDQAVGAVGAVDEQHITGRINLGDDPAVEDGPAEDDEEIHQGQPQHGDIVGHKPPVADQAQLQVSNGVDTADGAELGEQHLKDPQMAHPEALGQHEEQQQHHGVQTDDGEVAHEVEGLIQRTEIDVGVKPDVGEGAHLGDHQQDRRHQNDQTLQMKLLFHFIYTSI